MGTLAEQVSQLKTISFSALQDYEHCPHYYYLCNIKKLRKFTQNIFTIYGKLLHRCVQDVLMKGLDPVIVSQKFDKVWTRFCGLYKKDIAKELKPNVNPVDYKIPAIKSIQIIKEDFTKQFGKFTVLAVEEWVRELCSPKFKQHFVGCIDIVLKLENGDIVICDFKSCDTNYIFNKYLTKYKEYQLVFYKRFYCQKHNVDANTTETYFVTLERNIRSKEPLKFVRVTSGPVKIKNATEWLLGTLEGVNLGMFIKNRSACFKYGENNVCPFYNTEHCKK